MFRINDRRIGVGNPTCIVAELSANHGQDLELALDLLHAAKEAGADAVKIQTYTADCLTIDCDRNEFIIQDGLWRGRRLHELYREALTPWSWHPRLFSAAEQLGIPLFSTAFSGEAIDLLCQLGAPCLKIASFELVDTPLIRRAARTGKPLVLSAGMASLAEVEEAVDTARCEGADELLLLWCSSSYPAPPESFNLRSIPYLAERLDLPVGLSDHSMGSSIAVAAVSLGAVMVEKHFTLSRSRESPDACFSMEPAEFRAMVSSIRSAEKALGEMAHVVPPGQEASHALRRSLFVVQDLKEGERFSHENVRSIRPGQGLPPKYMPEVMGRRAACPIDRGTPLRWQHLAAEDENEI